MARSTVIVAIAVLIVSSTSAQNLLTNPGFDVADQLIGWSCSSTDGLATWISDDRLGAPTSGAMQHFVNAPLLNGQVACIQCLPVDEFYAYEASAWHYWPDDPDVTQEGTARMSIIFYSAVDCTGSLGVATVKVGYHVALDTWYQFATDEITAPAGATSARFTVTTWQDVAGTASKAAGSTRGPTRSRSPHHAYPLRSGTAGCATEQQEKAGLYEPLKPWEALP